MNDYPPYYEPVTLQFLDPVLDGLASKLTQWIYKNKRGQKRKVGYLVAFNIDGQVRVGFSLCSSLDKFNKELAIEIAESRALYKDEIKVPGSLVVDIEAFLVRCERYFKYASQAKLRSGAWHYEGSLLTLTEKRDYYLFNKEN